MAWHIDRQQDCLPDVQWRRGRLVSWPQHGRHCMATVCACGGTRWMECRCEVWESATSYGDEQQYVSSYYQYACVQCAGAAAEHLQGRGWPVFLISLPGGSTCSWNSELMPCCTLAGCTQPRNHRGVRSIIFVRFDEEPSKRARFLASSRAHAAASSAPCHSRW